MQEIVQSVQRVTQVMGQINASAAEQRDGVAQVSEAVGALDQMTQQNAALVEESAAAAFSLREQSEHLRELVQRFQVPDSVPQRTAAAAVAATVHAGASAPALAGGHGAERALRSPALAPALAPAGPQTESTRALELA